jgi:hypothetical protein
MFASIAPGGHRERLCRSVAAGTGVVAVLRIMDWMAGRSRVRSLLVSPSPVSFFFTFHTRFLRGEETSTRGVQEPTFFLLLLVFTQRGLAFSVMSLIVLVILIVGAAKGAASI